MHLHKIYHFILIHCHLATSPKPTAPAGGPRRGNHVKGTFKETAPLIFPTNLLRPLGGTSANSPKCKVACVLGF